MSTFSTHCFRDFKRFIGELTANAAGTYIAACFTGDNLPPASDPWGDLAKNYEIKVDGIKTEQVLKSSSRLNMVSIYSGFDLYLAAFRKQYTVLSEKNWIKEDKDSPFEEIRRNLLRDKIRKAHDVADEMIDVIEYYRLFRNSVAHPSDKNKKNAEQVFIDSELSRESVRNYYCIQSAPNSPNDINFHDVKLFSRILLDLLPKFDEIVDPGDDRLLQLLPSNSWLLLNDERKKNARIGFLVNTYGLDRNRASEIIGSLA
ncbi:hypothetical protein J5X91_08030 [Pseudoalteromonas sp. K222D]|uniref:hypothetical protein n=1 Tax=Pseudoalteromonas sp. K222D TaxID=2820756 RepID=UPI001AD7C601|nr:hypothetical protein [Pseudoalteromonas sp. K222D]MBO7926217.1 hypothetical protein [Pseudoalteromonas sp. K222D]